MTRFSDIKMLFEDSPRPLSPLACVPYRILTGPYIVQSIYSSSFMTTSPLKYGATSDYLGDYKRAHECNFGEPPKMIADSFTFADTLVQVVDIPNGMTMVISRRHLLKSPFAQMASKAIVNDELE